MRTRYADIRGEKALGLFLDRYFYETLAKDLKYDNKEKRRINDKVLQLRGIDVTIDGKRINIDEKAALRYIGEDLQTFAFEIDFFSNKEDDPRLVDGWFLCKNNLTHYYLLMWIKKSSCGSEQLGRIMAEDFEEVEAYLIDKQKIKDDSDAVIIDYAQKKGITDIDDTYKAYKALSEWMRDHYTGRVEKIDDDCVIYSSNKTDDLRMTCNIDENHIITYSPCLSERSVNLRIKKTRLYKLAVNRYKITKDSVVSI